MLYRLLRICMDKGMAIWDWVRTLTWSWQLGGREGYGLWWPESGEVIYHRVSRQTAASHYCYGHSTIISPSPSPAQQGNFHILSARKDVLASFLRRSHLYIFRFPPNAVHLLNDFIKERTFSVESFDDHWGRRGFDSLLMRLLPGDAGIWAGWKLYILATERRWDPIKLYQSKDTTQRHIDIGYSVSGYAKIFYLLSYPIERYE